MMKRSVNRFMPPLRVAVSAAAAFVVTLAAADDTKGPLVLEKVGSFFVGGKDVAVPCRSGRFISPTAGRDLRFRRRATSEGGAQGAADRDLGKEREVIFRQVPVRTAVSRNADHLPCITTVVHRPQADRQGS